MPQHFPDDTLTPNITNLLPAAFPKKRVYRIVFGLSALALLFSAVKTLVLSSSRPAAALYMFVPALAAVILLVVLERRDNLPRAFELCMFGIGALAFFSYFTRTMLVAIPSDDSSVRLMARQTDWFIWTPLLYATTSLLFKQRQALQWCALFYVLNMAIGLTSHIVTGQRGIASNVATFVDFQLVSIIVISLTYFVRDTAEQLVKREKTHRHQLEQHYRTLFDNSPVALWEEDLSLVNAELKRLQQAGVNLAEHLCDHTELMRLFRLISLHDVNQEALRYFQTAQGLDNNLQQVHDSTYDSSAYEASVTTSDLTKLQAGRMLKGYGYYQWYLGLLSLAEGDRYFAGNHGHPKDRYKARYNLKDSDMTSTIYWQVLNANAPFSRVLVSRVDLHSLRAAEAELIEERRLLRTLIDALPDFVIALDPEQRIRLANKAVAEALNTTPKALKHKPYHDVVHPQLAIGLEPNTPQDLTHKPVLNEERTVQGRHMLTSRVPLVNDADELTGLVLASRDISELKATERQVREKQILLTRAQHLAKLGNWRLNTSTGQLEWSDETFHIVGRNLDEGMPTINEYYSYLPEEDRLRARNVVQEAIEHGQPYQVDHRVIRPDGQLVHVHSRREAAEVAQDGTIYLMGTIQDISDRKVLELELNERNLELNQAVDEARAANQARDRFIASISHELRTPLNAISGFAQLLELDHPKAQTANATNNDGQWLEDIAKILEATKLLGGIIDDMIFIAHGEDGYGSISLNLQEVPLGTLIEEACGLLQQVAAQSKVDLHIDLPLRISTDELTTSTRDIPLTLRADAYKLKQVLLNLLNNAIKYNVPGGQVWVRVVRRNASSLGILVEDTGRGIDAAQLEHLFTPFERLGVESSTIPGHGLGLSLSKAFVEAMGGHIEVRSELGQGSCFEVVLPISSPVVS
ncbi:MAG: ATP-binding protein [Deinococcota bacterium]